MAVVFAASFLIYVLAANAGDPLEDLRGSTAPNKEALIAAKIQQLNLDVPPPLRYFIWLSGVAKLFIGQIDLGRDLRGTLVTDLLASSIWSTLNLVTAATVLSVLLGVSIGMATALRQYSGFDYTVTFISFLFFSLPVFWVAQLLKLYVAIGFNDFLRDPVIPPLSVVIIALVMGFVWASIVGGSAKKYFTNFGVAILVTGAGLGYILLTDGITTPSLGILWVGILGLLAAFGVTYITTGLSNRRALYSSVVIAALGAALWYPIQFIFFYVPGPLGIAAVFAIFIILAIVTGLLFRGDDRAISVRSAVITGIIVALLIVVDRIMGSWPDYVANTGGRPIATIGSATPNLNGSVWIEIIDTSTHLILPTMALMLLSLAAWSRYSRASLLEVMNQDYVRTARAKGLTERTVVMRHAFRNALIPITTLVAFEIGALIGGAAITETVFGWSGMGRLFIDSVTKVDLNPLMGVFIITSIVALIFNLIADLTYSALDPRIRVNK
ncbi:MAG: ABC transporter permease subunit [Microbacteriaceae bacterium]